MTDIIYHTWYKNHIQSHPLYNLVITINVILKFHPFHSISNQKTLKFSKNSSEQFIDANWLLDQKKYSDLCMNSDETDYVRHWTKIILKTNKNVFDLKNVFFLFFFNCGNIYVIHGISYCCITRDIWYHPRARDMIYIAMV